MPKPANLNSKDIDEIVYYLEYMAKSQAYANKVRMLLKQNLCAWLRQISLVLDSKQ
jgi:hypothetical protein